MEQKQGSVIKWYSFLLLGRKKMKIIVDLAFQRNGMFLPFTLLIKREKIKNLTFCFCHQRGCFFPPDFQSIFIFVLGKFHSAKEHATITSAKYLSLSFKKLSPIQFSFII